jgi:uncharacterized membrane protein HdeD (DUF308 family)
MAKTKRKYTESHWLVFAIEGIVAFLLGMFLLFTAIVTPATLIFIVAIALIVFSFIGVLNVVYRRRRQHDWWLVLIVAFIQLVTAIALIYTKDHDNIVASTVIIAIYAILRGLFEMIIGVKSLTDNTDKFMWVVCGLIGIILGIIIFAYPAVDDTTFIKFFGTYTMIFGLTDLIFAVHSRNEIRELAAAKSPKKRKK